MSARVYPQGEAAALLSVPLSAVLDETIAIICGCWTAKAPQVKRVEVNWPGQQRHRLDCQRHCAPGKKWSPLACTCCATGQTVRRLTHDPAQPGDAGEMKRLNLSEWAIRHASLVRYLMIIRWIGGVGVWQAGAERRPGIHLQGHAGARGVAWGPAPTICSCKSPTGWKKADEHPIWTSSKATPSRARRCLIVNLKESVAPKMWPMPGIRCAKAV